jgi:hypothetical protein
MGSRLAQGHRHGAHSIANRLHCRHNVNASYILTVCQLRRKVAARAHQLEQQQQQQQNLPNIPLNLNGRAVAILWDLDNMSPSSLQLDLLPAVQELQVNMLRMFT